MYLYKVKFKTKDNKQRVAYVRADHGAEAQEVFWEDYGHNAQDIVSVEQMAECD